jgi:tight adherence protein C
MSPILLALACFVSMAVLTAGVAWLVRDWHAPMLARLRALGQSPQQAQSTVGVLTEDRPRSFLEKLLTKLGRRTAEEADSTADLVRDAPVTVDLAQQLVRAGIRRSNGMALLMGIRIALSVGAGLVGVLLTALVSLQLLPLAGAFALFGFIMPRFILLRLAANRCAEIQRSLPDAIDLLILCVEAGLGLNAAIVRVAEERSAVSNDPIAQELNQLAKELQMGVGRREAFRGLAERTGAPELRSLAVHLLHAERFGTSLSTTLHTQADSMRTHRRLQAEEMANKTQVKLLFPLIMFIFPPVMIVILMPAVMRLVEALKVLM